MEVYPEAKVILTIRDPEGWYKSVKQTILKGSNESLSFPINVMATLTGSSKLFNLVFRCYRKAANRFIHEGVFDVIEQGEEASVRYFNDWVEKVKDNVPAEKLLIYNVKEGWKPLCSFLQKPIPSMEFPRGNDTQDMNWRFKERKIRAYIFVFGIPILIGLFLYMILH